MILWEKSDCSPDWTELLSILADLAKLTEKCSKNCGLLPHMCVATILVMSPRYCEQNCNVFSQGGYTYNLTFIGQGVSEKKMFENVYDDGHRTDAGSCLSRLR